MSDDVKTVLLITLAVLSGLVLISALMCLIDTGFRPYHYEYTTYSGITGRASYCGQSKGFAPECHLDDGTRIYNVADYRRVIDE